MTTKRSPLMMVAARLAHEQANILADRRREHNEAVAASANYPMPDVDILTIAAAQSGQLNDLFRERIATAEGNEAVLAILRTLYPVWNEWTQTVDQALGRLK